MDILLLLIPLSVVLVFFIGLTFWWSLRNGQFEDMEGPAYKILMDDDRGVQVQSSSNEQQPASSDGTNTAA